MNNQIITLDNLTIDFSIFDFETLKSSILKDSDRTEVIPEEVVDLIFSYLFICGYLTQVSTGNKFRIPNKEIKKEFGGK